MSQITFGVAALLALVLITLPSTSAIVCTPNICDTVVCKNDFTKESCEANGNAIYKEKGGFCGCCPACVTQIKVGGPCLNLRGVPAESECEAGSVCKNNVCVAVSSCCSQGSQSY